MTVRSTKEYLIFKVCHIAEVSIIQSKTYSCLRRMSFVCDRNYYLSHPTSCLQGGTTAFTFSIQSKHSLNSSIKPISNTETSNDNQLLTESVTHILSHEHDGCTTLTRGVFRTQSNIYDAVLLQKWLTTKSRFFINSSIRRKKLSRYFHAFKKLISFNLNQ